MAIKKIVIKPADKKNTPNDPGRQAVPQRPADKRVTKKNDNTEVIIRREFNNAKKLKARD